jgi:hypothetical protein
MDEDEVQRATLAFQRLADWLNMIRGKPPTEHEETT